MLKPHTYTHKYFKLKNLTLVNKCIPPIAFAFVQLIKFDLKCPYQKHEHHPDQTFSKTGRQLIK